MHDTSWQVVWQARRGGWESMGPPSSIGLILAQRSERTRVSVAREKSLYSQSTGL